MMSSTIFFLSDILHSRDIISSETESNQSQQKQLIICYKDDQSLYKSTRKMSRMANRLLSMVANNEVKTCTAYLIRGSKNDEPIAKRLETEFGSSTGMQFSIEQRTMPGAPNSGKLQALAFASLITPQDDSSSHANILLMDLDGIIASLHVDSAGTVRWELVENVVSSLLRQTNQVNSVIHVKCDSLYRCISDIMVSKTDDRRQSFVIKSELELHEKRAQQSSQVIRRLRQKKGAADCPLSLHPIRYIQQRSSKELVEICRFHNYDKDRGCLRSKRARDNPNVKRCEMDHIHCHLCGEINHRAFECLNRKDDKIGDVTTGPMIFVETDEGIHLKPLSECDSESGITLPALVVLAGRLRGKTLASCEYLPLSGISRSASSWKKMPNALEHRGSHAAASPEGTGLVFVMGGGGVDGNLDTVECLDCNSAAKKWQTLPGRLSSPRHAFGSVAITSSAACLYAVGGWKYGTVACDTVEKLSFGYPFNDLISHQWEICAPMLKPRRLHSVVASADGKQIYVFGGYVNERYTTNNIEKYDIDTNKWTAGDDLPFGDRKCPLVQASPDWSSSNNTFLIFPFTSEDIGSSHSTEVLRYTPGSHKPFTSVVIPTNTDENKSKQHLQLPLKNWASFSVTSLKKKAKVYIVGGTINGKWTDRGFELDLNTMVWTELPAMHCARRRSVALVVE